MPRLTCVFVHGLAGWGSYDSRCRRMPYWGMHGGDVVEHLRGKGYDCVAASVDPMGSAWDRACELYAQLAGSRVDSGAAHTAAITARPVTPSALRASIAPRASVGSACDSSPPMTGTRLSTA